MERFPRASVTCLSLHCWPEAGAAAPACSLPAPTNYNCKSTRTSGRNGNLLRLKLLRSVLRQGLNTCQATSRVHRIRWPRGASALPCRSPAVLAKHQNSQRHTALASSSLIFCSKAACTDRVSLQLTHKSTHHCACSMTSRVSSRSSLPCMVQCG